MKKIRVAILGQGRSGRDIHGAYLSKDADRFQIVAVVDPLVERRTRAASEYGCSTYADYKELLGRDDIDIVVNASPSKFHVPISLDLLQHGLNVLSEKPLASKVSDVDRLIKASEKSGKLLAIFQQSRFAPYFQKIREVIASGDLGEIVQICVEFNGFSRRYDWQTLTSEMGGNLLNTGPHPLDQALQLFGNDTMPSIYCLMQNSISYGTAEDHVLLILSGDKRPIIRLEISSCCRFPSFTYNVYGTHGGLKGNTQHLEWEYYNAATAKELQLTTTPLVSAEGTPAYCSDSLEWIKAEWDASNDRGLFDGMSHAFYSMLYNTLTEGAALEITPQQVRQQIAVIEECQRQNPHIYGAVA